jgi:hypothetical protein
LKQLKFKKTGVNFDNIFGAKGEAPFAQKIFDAFNGKNIWQDFACLRLQLLCCPPYFCDKVLAKMMAKTEQHIVHNFLCSTFIFTFSYGQ